MKFVDLSTQQSRIKDELDRRIQAVLEHGQYILGPEVDELESQLSTFSGVKHCIGVSSGTDAILMSLLAIGVSHGDEVVIPAFSFFATVEVVLLLGAKPVYVDISLDDYCIHPDLLEQAISQKTKAIIAVSMYGQCPDMHAINDIASHYQIAVIEDGAQSFGAKYHESYSGALCDIGCTSFFPSKPLGAYGDGGACFTNDDKLAERLRQIRIHGQSRRYYHERIGINGRLDTIQAAILLSKLTIFQDELLQRQEVASNYTQLLSRLENIHCPRQAHGRTHVYAQYTISLNSRDELRKHLQNKGIPVAVHYPIPLHQHPATNASALTFPNAEYAANSVLSLPMHPYMEPEDQKYIADLISSFHSVKNI